MKETHVSLGLYSFMIIHISLVLETRNIIIGVQDKKNPIKIRFCAIKIQKVSRIINYRWTA